ncbi:hypothetical protein EP073_06065 [Geovibrio thiophilus]|uniref:Uncharacterized protein n=1 Tax=Geovibrio thiophilus TaxID=139438 RepID=A0A410JXU6_9BACT|nr:hypothetical protein [Geovibrio thiophilus]QAR32987.1 hypothetical protein EP073_06065 [Geovibrio thiophilus]
MLETVAVILGIVHTITMLIFVPVWNVLSKLNRSIGGVKDALQDLKLHISEKYSTKDDFYRLERQCEEAVQRVHERIDALTDKR